jgi:hypothetical protein
VFQPHSSPSSRHAALELDPMSSQRHSQLSNRATRNPVQALDRGHRLLPTESAAQTLRCSESPAYEARRHESLHRVQETEYSLPSWLRVSPSVSLLYSPNRHNNGIKKRTHLSNHPRRKPVSRLFGTELNEARQGAAMRNVCTLPGTFAFPPCVAIGWWLSMQRVALWTQGSGKTFKAHSLVSSASMNGRNTDNMPSPPIPASQNSSVAAKVQDATNAGVVRTRSGLWLRDGSTISKASWLSANETTNVIARHGQ